MEDQTKKQMKYSFCFASYLYNNFQNSKDRTLVIDTRNSESYSLHHIKGSINFTNQRIQDYVKRKSSVQSQTNLDISDILEILRNDGTTKFSNRRRCFCFFLCTENSFPESIVNHLKSLANHEDSHDFFQVFEKDSKDLIQRMFDEIEEEEGESIKNALEIYKALQKDRVRELFLVVDGANGFFNRYPYMATPNNIDHSSTTANFSALCPLENDFPHDILDGRLFLGSYSQSEKYALLSTLKITHVLNMTFECDNVHEDKGLKYKKIAILDEPDKGIQDYFKETYDFIHETLTEDKNHNILVHCALGKSRSASVIIMYLMKRFSWSFEKAYNFVKRKREIVDPNDGFIEQLQQFEKKNFTFENQI